MSTRREFLQGSVVAAALPFVSAAGIERPPLATSPIYKVIFDERFAASVAFANQARLDGLPVHGIRGDITALWFHDLDLRWKQGPAAIAGMTDANALFCLDLLARDKGMHVASREERPGGLVAWVIEPRMNAKP
jgi:hypothetical protein